MSADTNTTETKEIESLEVFIARLMGWTQRTDESESGTWERAPLYPFWRNTPETYAGFGDEYRRTGLASPPPYTTDENWAAEVVRWLNIRGYAVELHHCCFSKGFVFRLAGEDPDPIKESRKAISESKKVHIKVKLVDDRLYTDSEHIELIRAFKIWQRLGKTAPEAVCQIVASMTFMVLRCIQEPVSMPLRFVWIEVGNVPPGEWCELLSGTIRMAVASYNVRTGQEDFWDSRRFDPDEELYIGEGNLKLWAKQVWDNEEDVADLIKEARDRVESHLAAFAKDSQNSTIFDEDGFAGRNPLDPGRTGL